MRVRFNFVDVGTGFELGDCNNIELRTAPRVGDVIGISRDDIPGEALYHVESLYLSENDRFFGGGARVVNVLISPVNARH